ncbi:DUF4157 domain-containing protein [Streptomyces crystallinus]|uniref:eCIS core domain-containing protein n=1 Tax=Streptomyces crystallinus TaxID=68191 RepID=A0ABP3QGA5_9ACTN
MRAHEEPSGRKAEEKGRPPRRAAAAAETGGPLDAARMGALQGLVGNRAVARRVAQERHVHGDGCGHGGIEDAGPMKDTGPTGQLGLLGAAMNTPSRPLPDEVRKEAEPFYQTNFSSTRLHDDAVAQRATAAMGAEAMTIDNHIFLAPAAVRNKRLIGHELSHVKNNLAGVPETGRDNGAGVPVTDPGQGSERSAESDGDAFEAGEQRAPSVVARRAAGGGSGGAPAVQRMTGHATVARAKDTKGKGKAKAGDSAVVDEWQARYKKIAELARQCTCEQPDPRWGRVTEEVIIRYARSYAGRREEQSLRHVARAAYSSIGHQEKKAKAASAAGKGPEKKEGKEKKDKEEEVQAMLGNDTLFFSTNRDQSVQSLHRALLTAAGLDAEEEDAPGEALAQMLITDYDKPAPPDGGQEAAPGGSGKRRAATVDPQTGKRRQTGKGAGAAALPKYDDAKERDRQARLKIRQGLKTQAMPALSLDSAMDVDDPAAAFKRDNATLKALRNMKWVRLVDVSQAAAQDPRHRAYLAELVAGRHTGYAYLLHNGGGKEAQHAEQKLLMLLSHTGKDAGQFLIRGRKRPCRACLALLAYFKDELGYDIAFDPRGNHLFVTPLKNAYETFGDDIGPEGQKRFDAHFQQHMGPGQPMYASAPRNATPAAASAAHGIQEAVMGDDGGMEQKLALIRTENGKLRYPNSGEQPTVDTPSTSEASDESDTEGVSGLTHATRELSLRPKAPSAPVGDRKAREAEAKDALRARVEGELMPLMGSELLEEYQRKKQARAETGKSDGKPYKKLFPDDLLRKIVELTAGEGPPSQAFVAKEIFGVEGPALSGRLQNFKSGKVRKKPRQITDGEKQQLVDAMPDQFRTAWERGTGIPEFKEEHEEFGRLVFTIMFLGPQEVSRNSMADALHISPTAMANRVGKLKKKYGHLLNDPGEGPAPT